MWSRFPRRRSASSATGSCRAMVIGRLAARLCDEAPGAAALEAARQRLFDTLACYVAGAATPEGELLGRLPGDGTEHRIRRAAGTIRSTELDDIHIPSCATIGSIVVPAVLFAA